MIKTNQASNLIKFFLKYKREFSLYLLLLFITVIFFFNLFLHLNEVISPAYDFFSIFYYEKLFFVKSITNFYQIPLWNPFTFSGTPFLANPTTAVFYPTTLLFLLFPVSALFGFLFCLDIFLAGLFTYIYTKSLGFEIFPSLVSSIAFMFSGILVTLYIPGHLVVLDSIIWFPLLLYLINKLIEKQKKTSAVFLGLTVALVIFAGHTQISLYVLVFTVFYFLFLIIVDFLFISEVKSKTRVLALFLSSLMLGVGISSVQLLPSLEFASFSSRALGVSFEFASSFSIHPYQILSAVLPHFFGDNYIFWGKANFTASSIYMGIIPVFFVFFSFVKRSKYVLFFSILAIFTFIYATGESMPLFPALYSLFPKLNSFRVPSRTLYFFVFSVSVMSGFGVRNFLSLISQNTTLIKKVELGMITGLITLLLIIIYLYACPNSFKQYENIILRNSFAGGMDHYYIYNLLRNDLFIFLSITLLLTIVFLFLTFRKISIKTFKILIIFLALSDLFTFGQIFIQTKKPNDIFKLSPEKRIISADKSTFRVFDMEGDFQKLQNDLIPNVTGVHSLYLKSLEQLLYKSGPNFNQNNESFFLFSDINNPEILKLFNVKYVIAHKLLNKPFLTFLTSQNNSYLYLLQDSFPRAYFSRVKDEHGFFTPDSTGSVDITLLSPNRIKLISNTTAEGKIILSEVYYPGWKALLDNKQVRINKVNELFRSVDITSGKHEITFYFDPTSFKIGALISFATLLILIFVFYRRPTRLTTWEEGR